MPSQRPTRTGSTSACSHQALGTPEGLESAVVDSPIYDRALLRALRRWTGLEAPEIVLYEYDNGNGVFYKNGDSY